MLRRAVFALLPECCPIPVLTQVVTNLESQRRAFCQTSSSRSSSLASVILDEFRRDPNQAAASIAALPEAVRVEMLQALTKDMATPGSVKYISTLLRDADCNSDGVLQPCVAFSNSACSQA